MAQAGATIAAPYPGTALYQQARDNGWLPDDDATLLDERGVQAAALSYPNLNRTEIYESVETFYRRYYFRPRYIWKSLKKMASSREEAKRLLGEGVQFIGSMAKRRRIGKHAPAAAPSA